VNGLRWAQAASSRASGFDAQSVLRAQAPHGLNGYPRAHSVEVDQFPFSSLQIAGDGTSEDRGGRVGHEHAQQTTGAHGRDDAVEGGSERVDHFEDPVRENEIERVRVDDVAE
jgi:hypothetical protein